jgi:hypothetical protein
VKPIKLNEKEDLVAMKMVMDNLLMLSILFDKKVFVIDVDAHKKQLEMQFVKEEAG